MNEKIKQIADEARLKPLEGGYGWTYRCFDEFEQYFAEMIINKCAEIADQPSNVPGCGYITKTKGMLIKDYFGVSDE